MYEQARNKYIRKVEQNANLQNVPWFKGVIS